MSIKKLGRRNSNLLINEHPLLLLPTLAEYIGLNEAIILQQIRYWEDTGSGVIVDNRRWIYNTIPEWRKQFRFWSEKTIWSTIDSLRKNGYLDAKRTSPNPMDRTLSYSINYDKLDDLERCISQDLRDGERNSYEINSETSGAESTINPEPLTPTPQENTEAGDGDSSIQNSASQDTPKLKPRERGTNPRALGTNPRALGTNPIALGTNPRATNPTIDANTGTPEKRRPGRPRKPIPANGTQNAVESLESPPNALQMPNGNQRKPIQNEEPESDGDPDKATHHSLLSKSVAILRGAPVDETIGNLNHTEYYGSCEDDTNLPMGYGMVEHEIMDHSERIEGNPLAVNNNNKNISPKKEMNNSGNNPDPFLEDSYGTILNPVIPDWNRFFGNARGARREEAQRTTALLKANPHWEIPALRSAIAGNNPEKGTPTMLAAWKIRSWGDTPSMAPLPLPSESELPQLQRPMPITMLEEIGKEAEFYYRWSLKTLREEGSPIGIPEISVRAKSLWSKANKTPYPGA